MLILNEEDVHFTIGKLFMFNHFENIIGNGPFTFEKQNTPLPTIMEEKACTMRHEIGFYNLQG